MPRGILATVTARAGRGRRRPAARCCRGAYADEPFVHVLPRARWPHTAATLGSNAVPPAGHRRRRLAAGSSCVSALDNLGKGAAGQAVQCANLMLGLPETAGLAVDRESRHERHRARRASGPPVSPPGSRPAAAPDVALVVNDGPDADRRRRLHRQPGQGRAGAVEPAGAAGPASCAPWCSTPAAPTPAPARPGFQDTHATAEHTAAALTAASPRLIRRRRRRRGLLDRADRRAAADGQAAARGRRGGPRAVPRRRRRPPPRRS